VVTVLSCVDDILDSDRIVLPSYSSTWAKIIQKPQCGNVALLAHNRFVEPELLEHRPTPWGGNDEMGSGPADYREVAIRRERPQTRED